MKVELKEARVELEVAEGKSSVVINGQRIPIPREVGISLIFGERAVTHVPPPTPTSKPGLAKTEAPRRGCQSRASKLKLSASLKRYYANKRRKENAQTKKATPTKKHLNGKSHLNGASLHVN